MLAGRAHGDDPDVGGTVLVVDDQDVVRDVIKLSLESAGYRVLEAATPTEALALARAAGAEVDLLVTDVVMPEMNGRELAARLRTARPDLRTLFVSGYPATALAPRGVLEEGVHFLQKPFSVEDLAMSVRAALDAPRA
jgi:CheY-like chemotaxis protein